MDDLRQDDLRQSVKLAYEIFLNRLPESEAVVDAHVAEGSTSTIFRNISQSAEAATLKKSSPFYFYGHMFDAEAIIRRHGRANLEPHPDYLTNFMGVLIDRRYLPTVLGDVAGTIEPIPIPANWHADIAEWAAVLRAVELAKSRFVIAELGCGWGCWLNNAGVAARNTGLDPFLIGVEGDRGHVSFARECCSLNLFDEQQVTIYHGIAASRAGIALFPKQAIAGEQYGLMPIFNASETEREMAHEFDELPMFSLKTLIGSHDVLDLLHIDIQGGEADLVEESVDFLDDRVAYMVIGTHSRIIEGRLIAILDRPNWRLEIERPAIVALGENTMITQVDGVQGWRNMKLRPD